MGKPDEFGEIEVMEACGAAFGFALAAAAKEGAGLGTREGLTAFAQNLHTLQDQQRFSPDVDVVISGIVSGLLAWVNLDPDKDEWL